MKMAGICTSIFSDISLVVDEIHQQLTLSFFMFSSVSVFIHFISLSESFDFRTHENAFRCEVLEKNNSAQSTLPHYPRFVLKLQRIPRHALHFEKHAALRGGTDFWSAHRTSNIFADPDDEVSCRFRHRHPRATNLYFFDDIFGIKSCSSSSLASKSLRSLRVLRKAGRPGHAPLHDTAVAADDPPKVRNVAGYLPRSDTATKAR